MTKRPEFSDEELLFIEKVMDLQSSAAGNQLNKVIENHWIARVKNEDKAAELLLKVFFEHGDSYLITKSIREKIEQWRRK